MTFFCPSKSQVDLITMSHAQIFHRLNSEDRAIYRNNPQPWGSEFQFTQIPGPRLSWCEWIQDEVCGKKKKIHRQFQILQRNPDNPFDWDKAPPLSNSIKDRLRSAEFLIRKICQIMPYSANHDGRLMSAAAINDQSEMLDRKRQEYRVATNEFIRVRQGDLSGQELMMSEIDTLTPFLKAGIGNCSELADVGFRLSRAYFPEQKIETVRFVDGDHVFLVIDRKEDSNPNDYRSWGDEAVICDPWAGKCYPLSTIEKELFFFVGTCVLVGTARLPVMIPFDPKLHHLEICEQSFMF